jgi:hypothetical protein
MHRKISCEAVSSTKSKRRINTKTEKSVWTSRHELTLIMHVVTTFFHFLFNTNNFVLKGGYFRTRKDNLCSSIVRVIVHLLVKLCSVKDNRNAILMNQWSYIRQSKYRKFIMLHLIHKKRKVQSDFKKGL